MSCRNRMSSQGRGGLKMRRGRTGSSRGGDRNELEVVWVETRGLDRGELKRR